MPDCAIDVIDEVGASKKSSYQNFKNKNEANITIVSKDVEDVVSKWHIFHQEVLQNQIYHYLKLRKKKNMQKEFLGRIKL